ncbi:Presqualene diphosphate phosphatase, partial [Eufriesea mexicana]
KKREIPSVIRHILDIDTQLSKTFVKWAENLAFTPQIMRYCTALELSCHGITWFISLIAFIWILDNKSLYQMQVNLLIALLLDIIVIAVLKAMTRRRRPTINKDPTSIGPDKYSFPSGHCSRSMLIFYFFKYLYPISSIFLTLMLIWVFAVGISRVLMKKHYILDVSAGLFVGYVEGMLMSLLYLDEKTCFYLIDWISDEKIPGAEYGV